MTATGLTIVLSIGKTHTKLIKNCSLECLCGKLPCGRTAQKLFVVMFAISLLGLYLAKTVFIFSCNYFSLYGWFSVTHLFWSANIYVSHLFLSEQRGGRVEVFSVNLILRQWDMAVDLNWNLGFKFWSHSNLKEAKNTTAHYLEKCRDAGMSQFCHKLITGTFDKHIRDSSQLVIFSILAIYIC